MPVTDLHPRAEGNTEQTEPFAVAVIGAGASGVLVAAQFLRQAEATARLALIGADARAGRGVAYDTPYRSHLLNVPAGNMSAFPDDQDHFVRWLNGRLPQATAGTFAPRMLYGDYLADILAQYAARPTLQRFAATAVRLTRHNDLWQIHLTDGHRVSAACVVLALGNLLPPYDPVQLNREAVPAYVPNPWSPDVARGLAANVPVLVIGTGLTMVDVVLGLREQGHQGQIVAISRNGRLSQAHAPYTPRPLPDLPYEITSPRQALRWLRREITAAQHEGYNWRAVIDSLRPYTAVIWRQWSIGERASFLRHARSLWDIHRHRMPAQAAMLLTNLIEQKILAIHAGQITAVSATEQGVNVTWQPAGTKDTQRLTVARVINCTGPARDYTSVTLPLIAGLRDAGWLTPDPLKLGWATDDDGRLIGSDGQATPGLFTLGPPRIPGLWESLAMPEIRHQAADLGQLLAYETAQTAVTTSNP